MIVKDEEDVIGRCLECVKDIVDEIIVVDTGSHDNTKNIVLQYTSQLYDFEWIDDFSKARNYSLEKATKDYVMWLDADDIIDKKNQQALLEFKQKLSSDIDVVMMKYQMGQDQNFVFYRERLLKRSQNFRFVNAIHEVIVPTGNIFYSDITIIHQKIKTNDINRNLRIYEKILSEGQKLDTRGMFYYARELYEHQHYEKAIQQFQLFLQQDDAWIENQIEACLDLAHCFEAQNQYQQALLCLFDSFLLDQPRCEILCEIGHIFLKQKRYLLAIYWYKQALKQIPALEKGGFVNGDCYGFIPYIQLCVCYAGIHDYQKANNYNELAGQIKPHHPSYLYNKEYFKAYLGNQD